MAKYYKGFQLILVTLNKPFECSGGTMVGGLNFLTLAKFSFFKNNLVLKMMYFSAGLKGVWL